MEELLKFRVNIDYEFELFTGEKKEEWRREFEYLFLWMEGSQKTLVSQNQYSDDYLKKVLELTGSVPSIEEDRDQEAQNWWGPLRQIELEKRLNSKITSSELAIEKGLAHPETTIIKKVDQLEEAVRQSNYRQWILKSSGGVSGEGALNFQKDQWDRIEFRKSLFDQIEKEAHVFEPSLKRTMDIGTTFLVNDNRHYQIHNLNNAKGNFRGGYQLPKEMITRYRHLIDNLQPIYEHYQDLGEEETIEIDSFSYLEEGQLKWYPLCEVNCRKTMGSFLHYLDSVVFPQKFNAWILIPKAGLKKYFSEDEWRQAVGDSATILSPWEGRFLSLYFVDDDPKSLQYNLHSLWTKLSKKSLPLPSHWRFYF